MEIKWQDRTQLVVDRQVLYYKRINRVKYPEALELAGKKLPWVSTADHLGHTLSQVADMDKVCQ